MTTSLQQHITNTLLHDETPDYLRDYVSLMIEPNSTDVPSGRLRGPFDPNTAVRAHTGSKTLTTQNDTASVNIVFDPEVSARSDHMMVHAIERDSTGEAIAYTAIKIDVPNSNFSAIGVASSRLTVSNSSAADMISGDAMAGTLNIRPKNLMSFSMSDLQQKIPHTYDFQKSAMRTEGVSSFAMSSHLGKELAPTDAVLTSQMAIKRFMYTETGTNHGSALNGFGAPSSGSGYTTGNFPVQTVAQLGRQAKTTANPYGTLGAIGAVWDSRNLTDNPFSIASYGCKLHVQGGLIVPSGGGAGNFAHFTAVAFDLFGRVLASQTMTQPLDDGTLHGALTLSGIVDLHFSFDRTTLPIDRVCIAQTGRTVVSGGSSDLFGWSPHADNTRTVTLTVEEPRGNIATSSLNVVVVDGLNSAASLAITASSVIHVAPSAESAVSNSPPDRYQKFDEVVLEKFLQTVSVTLPRANTVGQTRILKDAIRILQNTPEFHIALSQVNAGWFGDAFKFVSDKVREGARTAAHIAEQAAPLLHTASGVARMVGSSGIPMLSGAGNTFANLSEGAADAIDYANQSGVTRAMRRM